MNITNITIEEPGQFFQGAKFSIGSERFSANVGLGGRQSSLYVFGANGDDCVRTHKIDRPELLAEVERIVRNQA